MSDGFRLAAPAQRYWAGRAPAAGGIIALSARFRPPVRDISITRSPQARDRGSWQIKPADAVSAAVRFDQHLGVHKVAISVDIVERGVKGALLRLDARAGDQEHHAGVKIDSAAISGAKLLDVVSDQRPVLLSDPLEQVPVLLRQQTKVTDMHALIAACVRQLG